VDVVEGGDLPRRHFVPKSRSPASPSPGMMYPRSFS
jgi:hypothetical protein